MINISEFLKDDTHNFSSTRLVFFVWSMGVLVMWILSCISATPIELQSIDPSIQTLLGILMSGKVIQKFGETKSKQTKPKV